MRRAAAAVMVLACCRAPEVSHRDDTLRHDLAEMRKAIAEFRADKHRGPRSLSELKTAHYLADVPIDPITGSRNWRVVTEQSVRNDDFAAGGSAAPAEPEIIDVRSRAAGRDGAGKPYAEY